MTFPPTSSLKILNIARAVVFASGFTLGNYWNYWQARICRSPKFGFDYNIPLTQQELAYHESRFNYEFVGYLGLALILLAICPLLVPILENQQWIKLLATLYWLGTLVYVLYRLSGEIRYDIDFSNTQLVFYPYVLVAAILLALELRYYGLVRP